MKTVYSTSPPHQIILEVNKHSLVDRTEIYCEIFLSYKKMYILVDIVMYPIIFIEKLF